MNKDAWISLIVKILLMVLTPLAAQLHINDGATLSAFATDLADIIVLGYGMYQQWNMKRVPVNSVAVPVEAVNDANHPGLQRGVPVPVGASVKLPDPVKVIGMLLVALLLSALVAPSALAQSRPKLTGNIAADIANATAKPGAALTGNIQQDLQALWQKIVTSSLTDLNYAAAMAASANTTTSAIRLQCVKAIIQLNEQASGANLKNADGSPMVKPDPHLFTDVESLAEIIDNLSPQGPLFVSCAGAAQLAKTNVLTFVNGVVTGVAGFAAMPVIPGL